MSRVAIRRANPPGSTLLFDLVGKVDLSGGVGGWEEVARPRRASAAEWTGTPALTQVLPLLLDGMEFSPGADRSVEGDVAQLLAWGRPNTATGEPALLTLAGPLLATDGRWVIQDLSWGDEVRDGSGSRIQQPVTVTLLQHLAPQVVTSPAKKARAKAKAKKKNEKDDGEKKKTPKDVLR